MKRLASLTMMLLVSGCAMPGSVQRIGVGYNNAVASTTDELTLENVVRARNGYPLHYTSISRLTGSITLKVTGGFNSTLKGKTLDKTGETGTQPSGVVNTVTREVTTGGAGFTPSLGGEVDTNPSFDVDVNDSKEFETGISAGIEPDTVLGLIDQGFDRDELLYLTIGKVDFTLKNEVPWYDGKKGLVVLKIDNDGTDASSDQLTNLLDCYDLKMEPKDSTELAPLSRVTSGAGDGKTALSMRDLSLLDGTKLDLAGKPISDPSNDKNVKIVRPSDKKVGRLQWLGKAGNSRCSFVRKPIPDDHGRNFVVYEPAGPPAANTFVGNNMVLVESARSTPTKPELTYVDVDMEMFFRSPEQVIKFIGSCLKPEPGSSTAEGCIVKGKMLFELQRGDGNPYDIKTMVNGVHYYIAASTPTGRASMRTLALIEKLINLHKSAIDKAVTAPVRVVS